MKYFYIKFNIIMLIVLNSVSLALAVPQADPDYWQWVCSNSGNTWNWYISRQAPENYDGDSCSQKVLTVVNNEKYSYSITDESFCFYNGRKYFLCKKTTMYNAQNKVIGVNKSSKWEEPLINSAAEDLWDAVNVQLQQVYGSSMYGYPQEELLPCPSCGGTGLCSTCSGAGSYTVEAYPEPIQEICWDCGGTGQCRECSGAGCVPN